MQTTALVLVADQVRGMEIRRGLRAASVGVVVPAGIDLGLVHHRLTRLLQERGCSAEVVVHHGRVDTAVVRTVDFAIEAEEGS